MRSRRTSPPIEIPAPTPADVVALRRASEAAAAGDPDYLAFLARFPPATTQELRARKGPRGAPFRL
jgi:hypothetical protein